MKIAFDISEMKVGCVLVQAGYGVDSSICRGIDPKHWLLAPTPNMKVYDITEDQLDQLIENMEKLR